MRDMNPIGVYDPTLYELEWDAHKTAGEYMSADQQAGISRRGHAS